jgi:hypothetical protein
MSKPELKKYLNVHTKDQLVKIILDMYSSNELVKQYCEHLLKPVFVDNDSLDKYKRIIAKEFDLMHPMSAGNSFAKARKAISEFAALKPNKELMADLLLTLPEAACTFSNQNGDMGEQYYRSVYNNFKRAMEFLRKKDLLDAFKTRCNSCVSSASNLGYGYGDDMWDIYYEYYRDSDIQ